MNLRQEWIDTGSISTEGLLEDDVTEYISQFQTLLTNITCNEYRIVAVAQLKSAQQRVLLLKLKHCPPQESMQTYDHELRQTFEEAIKDGDCHLVLRIWKGSARWWDLNSKMNSSCLELAKSEVSGYELARSILDSRLHPRDPFIKMRIPKVLYFQSSQSSSPWAVFSYVNSICNFVREHADYRNWTIADDFIMNMVKVRHEFGFLEPHPRHGRVSLKDSLQYALNLLDSIVIPIHLQFFVQDRMNDSHVKTLIAGHHVPDRHTSKTPAPITYERMIDLYENNLRELICTSEKHNDDRIKEILHVLDTCVQSLRTETLKINHLPPTLCHCDLQPQNAIFCREGQTLNDVPHVVSILDWEEAAIADPRFEIMLICRKVVANHEQALVVWNYYHDCLKTRFSDLADAFGPLEPWLKLEGVHALLTLCMQVMDMQGGGRDPWEQMRDLLGKINRQLFRLESLGLKFCNPTL